MRRNGKRLQTKWSTRTVCAPHSSASDCSCSSLATLKNDDAEDSGDEGDEDDEIIAREKKAVRSENVTSEKQPTGRIVGVIKRNWRA